LETLVGSAQGDATKLEQLQNHMDQLRLGVTIGSISPKAHTQLRKLLDLSEEACQIITQQRILRSLAFDDMHGRFEAVDTAHYKTFDGFSEITRAPTTRNLLGLRTKNPLGMRTRGHLGTKNLPGLWKENLLRLRTLGVIVWPQSH